MYQSLLREQLELLKSSNQYRTFTTLSRICGQYPLAKLAGDRQGPVVVWCSNDYLGMSQHPAVCQAMHLALDAYGAGSGGSRNIGGSHELYARLENSLADWHGKEAALVFPTGFGSNDATLQCLLRQIPDCVVVSDALNHASIVNGIRATPNERKVFGHNDVEHLERILSSYPLGQPKLVVFESIYSMDGDIAPIAQIVELAKRYNARPANPAWRRCTSCPGSACRHWSGWRTGSRPTSRLPISKRRWAYSACSMHSRLAH